MRRTPIVAALVLSAFTAIPGLSARARADGAPPAIRLRSRAILPAADPAAGLALMERALAGLKSSPAAGPARPAHAIVQLAALPDAAARDALRSAGLELEGYLSGGAFLAAVRPGARASELARRGVTWLGPLTPADKVAPRLAALVESGKGPAGRAPAAADFPAHARLAGGRVALYVEFHREVTLADGIAEVAQAAAGEAAGRVESLNGAVLAADPARLAALAAHPAIKWIEPASPALSDLNSGARVVIGAETAQAAPYNLSGTGVTVLVYDGGLACSNHPDLTPRVVKPENGYQTTHATHVAGTLGGSGASSGGTFRGMAPAVSIVSYMYESCNPMCLYDNPQDIEQDYAEGMAQHGADFSTNSLGANINANGYDCELLGDYESTARLIDAIARGSLGRPFLSFWAAGNERQGDAHCGDLYYTMGVPATAKNSIVIGATNSNDNSLASFSSLGPTDDGRLRPDLVAPGCQVGGDGGITSLRVCAGHTVFCGTSMATPAAAGAAALVLERLRSSARGEPSLPAAMKAILMASAGDLGNPGPDYMFGYGQIDVPAAIAVVDGGMILESGLAQGEIVTRTLAVPAGRMRLRAALAWDDAPGEPLSLRNLVNDLDLRLIDPSGGIHLPFVLDPGVPSAPASRGANRLDPSEMVEVSSPAPGQWRLEVEGVEVPVGPQTFAVVTEVPEAGASAVDEPADAGAPGAATLLAQNAPNPFNPVTTIRFQVSHDGPVALRISDLRGTRVRTLVDGRRRAGAYAVEWDGRDARGREVASGVYVYTLEAGGRTEARRMILVK